NYVPRPKNSFILFRTEFVAQKTASGTRSAAETKRRRGAESDDDDDEANQSLSKQASAIWNRMTEAEKRPWAERAKLEKAAHEAKYPNYRYRPIRQSSTR
ncbi:uncharacterized protein FOMMEDRAFT_44897, partial [Fomitiporia mediterranea MF3/22]|uniref:uncharacterized protein n=1 Tax=Fomitiporia mediterranea (strain MF3/22) TaxID=694068 RepID=UPI00044086DC